MAERRDLRYGSNTADSHSMLSTVVELVIRSFSVRVTGGILHMVLGVTAGGGKVDTLVATVPIS